MFSEIVGNVSTQDNRSYYALSTLDGMYSKRCVVICGILWFLLTFPVKLLHIVDQDVN